MQALLSAAALLFGTSLLPVLVDCCLIVLQYILVQLRLLRPEKRKITILNKVSSILTPGRTTLLLGPPGGGKVCTKCSADALLVTPFCG